MIVIVDDDPKAIEAVVSLLRKYKSNNNVQFTIESYTDEHEFLNIIDSKTFNLYILDIFLADTSGIDIAKRIRQKNIMSELIFTTTSIDFYRQAYQLHAIQYLEKPIDERLFFETLDRVMKADERFLTVQDGKKIIRIPADEILYCESDDHYKRIVTKEKSYFVRMTMKELMSQLGDSFFALSPSLLVNLKQVVELQSANILMADNRSIVLPSGKYTAVSKEILKYMF